jgi:hypothetical protein
MTLRICVVSSDPHRAYLAQLCGAFRLSQPLDALLRSRPTRLVSYGIRSWVLRPSEDFPPRLARIVSRRYVPLVSFPYTQRGPSRIWQPKLPELNEPPTSSDYAPKCEAMLPANADLHGSIDSLAEANVSAPPYS